MGARFCVTPSTIPVCISLYEACGGFWVLMVKSSMESVEKRWRGSCKQVVEKCPVWSATREGKVVIAIVLNLHHQATHLIHFKVEQEQLMQRPDRMIDPSVFAGVNVSSDSLTNTELGSGANGVWWFMDVKPYDLIMENAWEDVP